MFNQTVLDLYHSSLKDLIYDPGHIFPSLGLSDPISTMKKGISERVSLHDLEVLSWLFSFPELKSGSFGGPSNRCEQRCTCLCNQGTFSTQSWSWYLRFCASGHEAIRHFTAVREQRSKDSAQLLPGTQPREAVQLPETGNRGNQRYTTQPSKVDVALCGIGTQKKKFFNFPP